MLIPLFSEYRYMYPLEPEYEYVPKEAVLLAAIVPSFFPLESATIKLRVELPLLLNTTLIVSEPDTGTLTERYDVVPVPERARQYVYAVPSTVTTAAKTLLAFLIMINLPNIID